MVDTLDFGQYFHFMHAVKQDGLQIVNLRHESSGRELSGRLLRRGEPSNYSAQFLSGKIQAAGIRKPETKKAPLQELFWSCLGGKRLALVAQAVRT